MVKTMVNELQGKFKDGLGEKCQFASAKVSSVYSQVLLAA